MLSPQEVIEQYQEKVDEFFRVTFAMTDEQTAAF